MSATKRLHEQIHFSDNELDEMYAHIELEEQVKEQQLDEYLNEQVQFRHKESGALVLSTRARIYSINVDEWEEVVC